ncbi:MAG: hypothetical protein IKA99_08505 [Clostridia bacterium]|nr:hypothetical protein [Clostridia bacterium]
MFNTCGCGDNCCLWILIILLILCVCKNGCLNGILDKLCNCGCLIPLILVWCCCCGGGCHDKHGMDFGFGGGCCK